MASYLSLQLFHRVFFSWPVAYFLFFSVFLFLYIPKFVDMTINTLNTLDNTDTETILSLLTLLLSLLHKARVAMRFSPKIASSCGWLAIPVN